MTTAREFTNRLADLLRREHHAMADFLVALADFDQRRLWLDLGYASLFDYLHRELGLSKGAAHYRKVAAEMVQKFPEVLDALREGKLCITSIVSLAKVLTPENREETLPRFFHRSRREAMEVAAAIQPANAAPHREVVTAIRTRVATAETATRATFAPRQDAVQPVELTLDLAQANEAAEPASLIPAPPRSPPRDVAEPVAADLFRYHVTVSRRFLDKLDAARAALSHARPGATAEEILEAGLDLVLAQRAKRKGLVAKPRKEPTPANPDSDHIPAHVRRAVWLRDGGRCQYPLEGGGVCGSTYQVEFDHIRPRALGGPSTFENIRCACKSHNGLAARKVFGDAWMDRFTRNRRSTAGATPDRRR